MGTMSAKESVTVLVERMLRESGYTVDRNPYFGVILEIRGHLSRPRRFLWRKWEVKEEFWFGKLYFSNKEVGATSKNWVLEVTGREIYERMQSLGTKLANQFETDVHVRLTEDELKPVTYYTYD